VFFKLFGCYRMDALDMVEVIKPPEQYADIFVDNGSGFSVDNNVSV